MNVIRITPLFQLVTEAANVGVARPHIAGWSESFWDDTPLNTLTFLNRLLTARARLLPKQCQIIGYRVQNFDLQPNRLIPGGSATYAVNFPGNNSLSCDIPQMALSLSARSTGAVNTRRFLLRGIPDSMVVTGEFTPTDNFQIDLAEYRNQLSNASWNFLSRDLTLPSYRVNAIAMSTIQVGGPHAIAVGAFVRLLRVRDKTGKSIRGVFRVTAVPDANSLTVDGLTGVIVGVSGAIREDRFALPEIKFVAVGRISVKKVGRPFEQYRGRRSKRGAA